MSSSSYARLGYMALKVEATENTAVIPNVFIPILKEDVVAKYDVSVSMPVSAKRTINLRGLPSAIPAPSGKITINVEPKTIGHFLRGVYGTSSDGRYLPFSASTSSFVAGEIVTTGSGATSQVVVASAENDYVLTTGGWQTPFATGNSVYGVTSSATAVLGTVSNSVYGHQFVAPQTSLPTYTVEFGYLNEAVRFTGVRFHELMLNQKNNIITGEIMMTARAEFKHGRVTATTTTGGGSKTITLDQTTGLVVGDSIKVFRPSTGAFLDFASAGVATNTITGITSETALTVTSVTTQILTGDLIILAPQTTSYSVVNEFTWVGKSTLRDSETSITAALTATPESIEDFEINVINDLESRHAANGANIINRFPANNYLKGLKGNGKLKKVYVDMIWLDRVRVNRPFALQVVHNADQISSTGIYYTLDLRAPTIILNAFNPKIEEDALLDQEMPFTMFDNTTSNYFHKALLVNDITSY